MRAMAGRGVNLVLSATAHEDGGTLLPVTALEPSRS